jgi:hypothetical protein
MTHDRHLRVPRWGRSRTPSWWTCGALAELRLGGITIASRYTATRNGPRPPAFRASARGILGGFSVWAHRLHGLSKGVRYPTFRCCPRCPALEPADGLCDGAPQSLAAPRLPTIRRAPASGALVLPAWPPQAIRWKMDRTERDRAWSSIPLRPHRGRSRAPNVNRRARSGNLDGPGLGRAQAAEKPAGTFSPVGLEDAIRGRWSPSIHRVRVARPA